MNNQWPKSIKKFKGFKNIPVFESHRHENVLIIFGGLPGSGKTTIAKMLAQKLKAVYLRIDSIEQALIKVGVAEKEMDDKGYQVAYGLAAENLQLNMSVIADSVNPLNLTREAWRNVAHKNNMPFLEVEIICSNKSTHRRRIESRTPDILNHKLPSWAEVLQREYDPWLEEHLIIDTAKMAATDAVNTILSAWQAGYN